MRNATDGTPWRYRGAGHVNLFGDRVTVYGTETAMHGAVNIRTPWGYLCFKPPLVKSFGHHWPWYLYLSPNATPWAAKWGFGLRRFRWGFIRQEVD